MPSPELRVGLIGYGVAGRVFHAPLIAATRGLALRYVVTTNHERQEAARSRYPEIDLLASSAELFARAEDLDLVVIASNNDTHAPLARQAIDAGLAVVVDKPMATNSTHAGELIAHATARSVPLTVFQNRRWDGDFLTVRLLLRQGRLGEVHRFESRFERWRPTLSGGWRESADPAIAGGLLFDLGAHLIDQAVQLFGPVHTVYAELDNRRPGACIDDDTFVALQHMRGVRSHLSASAVAAQPGPRFRVLGSTAAYLKYGRDNQEDQLRAGFRPDDHAWCGPTPEEDGTLGTEAGIERIPTRVGRYQQFYVELAASLRDGTSPPVDPSDAQYVLQVIEAAARSARADETVHMP